MSRLSFKAFCIELYADYKSIPSNEVFTLFEKNGILQMLDEDYDVLHGHGFNYVIQDIEEIIASSDHLKSDQTGFPAENNGL